MPDDWEKGMGETMAATPLSLPYYTTVRAGHPLLWSLRSLVALPQKGPLKSCFVPCPREKVWSNHIPRDCSNWEAGRSLLVIPQQKAVCQNVILKLPCSVRAAGLAVLMLLLVSAFGPVAWVNCPKPGLPTVLLILPHEWRLNTLNASKRIFRMTRSVSNGKFFPACRFFVFWEK